MNRLQLLVSTVIPSLLLSACSEPPAPVQMPPPTVVTQKVASQAVTLQRDFIGRTAALERVELRARVSGFLEQKKFAEGGGVQRGDLLFVIESDAYRAKLTQAEAQLAADNARLEEADVRYKRLEKLRKNGNVSEQDVDEARAARTMAEAAVVASLAAKQQAELDLSSVEIRSPLDGLIGRAAIDPGNLISPETGVLATVVNFDPINVDFTLSDTQYLQFRRQQDLNEAEGTVAAVPEFRLRLSDDSVYEHTGKMRLTGNEIDPGTGTISLRAVFPNPDLLLRPGQFVNLTVRVEQSDESIVVPNSSVLTGQAGHSVLVVNDSNTVEQRNIVVGEQLAEGWIVQSGLNEGEQIIVRGLQKARPGIEVTVNQAQ